MQQLTEQANESTQEIDHATITMVSVDDLMPLNTDSVLVQLNSRRKNKQFCIGFYSRPSKLDPEGYKGSWHDVNTHEDLSVSHWYPLPK